MKSPCRQRAESGCLQLQSWFNIVTKGKPCMTADKRWQNCSGREKDTTNPPAFMSVKVHHPLGEPSCKANRWVASSVQLDLIGKEKISILISGREIYSCTSHWEVSRLGWWWRSRNNNKQWQHLLCCSPTCYSELWHFKVRLSCWEVFVQTLQCFLCCISTATHRYRYNFLQQLFLTLGCWTRDWFYNFIKNRKDNEESGPGLLGDRAGIPFAGQCCP
jgi:hypothetical protein